MKKKTLRLILSLAMILSHVLCAFPIAIGAENAAVTDASGDDYAKYQGTYLDLSFDSDVLPSGWTRPNNSKAYANFHDGIVSVKLGEENNNNLNFENPAAEIDPTKPISFSYRFKMSGTGTKRFEFMNELLTSSALSGISATGHLCVGRVDIGGADLRDGKFHTVDILFTPIEDTSPVAYSAKIYLDGVQKYDTATMDGAPTINTGVAAIKLKNTKMARIQTLLRDFVASDELILDYVRIGDGTPVYGRYQGTYIDYSFDGERLPGYAEPNGVSTTIAGGFLTATKGTATNFNLNFYTTKQLSISIDMSKPISLSYRFKITSATGVDNSTDYFELLTGISSRMVAIANSGAPMFTKMEASSSLGNPNLRDGVFHEIDVLYTPVAGSTTGERTAKLYIDGVLKYDTATGTIATLNNAVKSMSFKDSFNLIQFMLKGTWAEGTAFVLDYVRIGDGSEWLIPNPDNGEDNEGNEGNEGEEPKDPSDTDDGNDGNYDNENPETADVTVSAVAVTVATIVAAASAQKNRNK